MSMSVEDRKILFKTIHPLINQGMNADKMTKQQYEKMVDYSIGVLKNYNGDKVVSDLLFSILSCFDFKEQEKE